MSYTPSTHDHGPGTTMGEFSIQQFEDSCRENGIRFWYAHEFMGSLGYDSWASFQKVLTRAMGACAKLNIDPTEAFIPATYIQDGKECKTYKLTRFACFLVSMHGDSKKEEVAKAKTLLAAIADQLIDQHIQEHDLGRIEVRDDLKTAERMMSAAAMDGGLESSQFGIFKDAGFRGMYNMPLQSLIKKKGGQEGKPLYDFMGLEELAGNLFRVTQTSARIRAQSVQGLKNLSSTAQKVGSEVREIMVRNSGVAPESLPLVEDISGVKKRLKSAHRAMGKLDGKKKVKGPSPT